MSKAASVLAAAGRPGRMVAMVLGTALSTLGSAPAANPQTVNDLSRYCTACWRNARLPADCWPDCTQEVFTRLLERVPPGLWGQTLSDEEGHERREFLRAIDAVKKRVQRGRKWSAYPEELVADHRPTAERQQAEVREELSQAAAEVLSGRQQQIIRWSAEGWGVQEIADRLAIGPERVSDEKYKAIRKLRSNFQAALRLLHHRRNVVVQYGEDLLAGQPVQRRRVARHAVDDGQRPSGSWQEQRRKARQLSVAGPGFVSTGDADRQDRRPQSLDEQADAGPQRLQRAIVRAVSFRKYQNRVAGLQPFEDRANPVLADALLVDGHHVHGPQKPAHDRVVE
jgi:RNA polymerase sigma factor (sigma-70 family)